MYVPRAGMSPVRRIARWALWKVGDAFAKLLSSLQGFHLPDEPLQPFAVKLPMLLGLYERHSVKWIKTFVQPGMVVVDGGAHAGYLTRLFSRLVGPSGKVLAFEIHPATLELLRRNTRGLANVEIIPAALGPADGTTRLFVSGLSSGHSATAGKPGLIEGEPIPVRSLSSVLKERDLRRADFVKLDIEGGEPAVLRNLPEGPITVLFEVKRYILEAEGETPEALLAEMMDRGFVLRRAEDDALLERSDLVVSTTHFDKANIIALRR